MLGSAYASSSYGSRLESVYASFSYSSRAIIDSRILRMRHGLDQYG
ncbi:hypothetical protein Taro_050209 [Colocasia esculenta]|uniref:Uncharacterized protein n=1 Tax=Colocasia esculenta TaxID=4460 RepID=A0A843XD84_COLES|nr:hypothetical protein [Colocasia esculenta]